MKKQSDFSHNLSFFYSYNVCIEYETSPEASGLQWLEANQTNDKKQPFLFSQCQAVHARSMVPCQDTPAVKTPYTADVSLPVLPKICISILYPSRYQHHLE